MLKLMKKVLSIILVLALMMSCFTGCGAKQEAYRTIAVSEANGTTNITRSEKESFDAYAGVHLLSGDDAKVKASSDMTLELDTDKHVYAEENTHFFLTADGEEGSTKTVINLDDGSVLICIDKKLGAEESFEVDTPNSTMSVRGTVFRVTVETRNGKVYTTVQTFDGAVEVVNKFSNGQLSGETFTVSAGEEILVISDADSVGTPGITAVNYAGLAETTKAKLKVFGVDESTLTQNAGTGEESQTGDAVSLAQAKLNESHWVLTSSYCSSYTAKTREFNDRGLVVKSGNEYGYTLYEYNDDNVLISEETYDIDDGAATLSYYYKYNDDGTLAEEFRWEDKTLYFYYPDGTLKREELYINLSLADYLNETYPDEWTYFGSKDYNEHGDVVYEETYGSVYDLTVTKDFYTYRDSYEYDSDGRVLSHVGGDYSHTYEYDENKNLIAVNTTLTSTGERELTDEASYEYELINGEYKVVHSFIIYNEEGYISEESTYRYDDIGQKVFASYKTIYLDSDGNPWDDNYDYYEEEYEYDEYGNVTKWVERYSSDYVSVYSYSPAAFPEGKKGDLFTRTVTTERDGEVSVDVNIYRYVD